MKFQKIISALRFNRFFWGGCAFILLLNLVLYATVIQRQENHIERLQALYSKKRNPDVPRERDEIAKYRIAGMELKVFKGKLPPKEAFVDRVRELHQLLHQNGLQMQKLIFKPERVGPLELWKYTSSFSVRGRYSQLKPFIAGLQNSQNLFCLDHVSFKRVSRSPGLIDMHLEVSTYFK
jgi:Tfp pilus assembly protein PilO